MIESLADVNIKDLNENDILVYNSTTKNFENKQISEAHSYNDHNKQYLMFLEQQNITGTLTYLNGFTYGLDHVIVNENITYNINSEQGLLDVLDKKCFVFTGNYTVTLLVSNQTYNLSNIILSFNTIGNHKGKVVLLGESNTGTILNIANTRITQYGNFIIENVRFVLLNSTTDFGLSFAGGDFTIKNCSLVVNNGGQSASFFSAFQNASLILEGGINVSGQLTANNYIVNFYGYSRVFFDAIFTGTTGYTLRATYAACDAFLCRPFENAFGGLNAILRCPEPGRAKNVFCGNSNYAIVSNSERNVLTPIQGMTIYNIETKTYQQRTSAGTWINL